METSWYDALAEGIRKNRTPGDEGAFWVLFLDDERCPAFCAAFPPAADLGPPEYDGLAEVIDAVDAPALVFVVPRSDGEPAAGEWRIWQELRARLAVARCELIDLVIVGSSSWWSAVRGRPGLSLEGTG
jgi:hypothetical protein